MKKQERGITLIALVVTIVVLLILAAVSISMLGGENGIITQAIQAKEQTIIGEEKEAISISYTACKTKDYSKDIISVEEMQTEIDKIKSNVQVTMSGNDLIVFFKDTEHKYRVNQDGQISEFNLDEDSIIDMIDANIAVTFNDKVIYIQDSEFVEGQILELNTENYTLITENGVKKIASGVFIDNEGKVYTWGENNYGQLGNGTTENSNIPICISDLENDLKGKKIKDICSYSNTKIALDDEGKIYTWGENIYGQLGDGTTEDSNVPICISDLENDLKNKEIIRIFEGSVVIDKEGKVYSWGFDNYGQIDDESIVDRSNPVCISDLENNLKGKKITDIYFMQKAIIAKDENGKVYTWGYNDHGQLGDGTTNDRSTPVCISDLENDLNGKNIVDIYIYNAAMIALDNQGKVYTCGGNWDSQLGDGTVENRSIPVCISNLENDLKGNSIINIYFEQYTIIAIDNIGKVYMWGIVYDEEIGNYIENKNLPICISDIEENPLNEEKVIKCCIFDFSSSSYYNTGYCYITQEGKIYYYYTMILA